MLSSIKNTLLPRRIAANFATRDDLRMFAEIAALATVLPLLLRRYSFAELTQRLSSPTPALSEHPNFSAITAKAEKFTDYILGRRFWIYQPNCLKRSLFLFYVLRKRGIAVQWNLGARFVANDLAANATRKLDGHAWLTYDGKLLLEPHQTLATHYAVTFSFPPADDREMHQLINCAAATFARDGNDTLADLDWPRFIELARQHRLLFVAHKNLSTRELPPAAKVAVASMKQELQHNAVSNMLMAAELCRIIDLLVKRGVRTLAYKGPVLSTLLYRNLTPRQFNDLDIFIDPSDREIAVDVLRQLSYRSRLELSWEHSWINDDTGIMIDVHWALTGPDFPFPLSFAEAWQRRQPVIVGGTTLFTLGKADTLLFQCINAAKEDWHSLGQIYEIGQLASDAELNWPALFARAKQLRCYRITLVGVQLAEMLFGMSLPAVATNEMANFSVIFPLCQQIEDRIYLKRSTASTASKTIFRMQMREHWVDRWPYCRQLFNFAFTPNEHDHARVALPNAMRGLYWIVRPWRLARKYTRKLLIAQR